MIIEPPKGQNCNPHGKRGQSPRQIESVMFDKTFNHQILQFIIHETKKIVDDEIDDVPRVRPSAIKSSSSSSTKQTNLDDEDSRKMFESLNLQASRNPPIHHKTSLQDVVDDVYCPPKSSRPSS